MRSVAFTSTLLVNADCSFKPLTNDKKRVVTGKRSRNRAAHAVHPRAGKHLEDLLRAVRQIERQIGVAVEIVRVFVFPERTEHCAAFDSVAVNNRMAVGKGARVRRVDKRRAELVFLSVETVAEIKRIVRGLHNRQVDSRAVEADPGLNLRVLCAESREIYGIFHAEFFGEFGVIGVADLLSQQRIAQRPQAVKRALRRAGRKSHRVPL